MTVLVRAEKLPESASFADFFWSPDTNVVGYRVCRHCVMDTTDTELEFDATGRCFRCLKQEQKVRKIRDAQLQGDLNLNHLFSRIKDQGEGRPYDAVLGVSGGVDSSYLAYLLKRNGIRTLAVHLDNGWNSELAVKNIQHIVELLNIDLYTHVVQWEEFRDLQLSFVKASVVDMELLTDHAINAILYQQAAKWGIKNVIMGFNVETEGNMPRSWVHNKLDAINIKSIHRSHGKCDIRTYPTAGNLTHELVYKRIRGIHRSFPLNYLSYDKAATMQLLEDEIQWRPYRAKHYESTFTEFYQGYILPRKCGIDKRRPHLSALIAAGRMTRPNAIAELQKPLFTAEQLRQQYEFVMKKWGLSYDELENYLNEPPKPHKNYTSDESLVAAWRKTQHLYRRITKAA